MSRKIRINGKYYSEETVQNALEAYVKQEESQEYNYGTIFNCQSSEYWLVTFSLGDGHYGMMVNTEDGAEFDNPIEIDGEVSVTEEEVTEMFGSDDWEAV